MLAISHASQFVAPVLDGFPVNAVRHPIVDKKLQNEVFA
jgi:hypothetical protein